MEMCSGTYLAAKKAPGRTMEICRGTFAGGALHTYIEVLRDRSRETQRASEKHGRTERARVDQTDLERVREAKRG